MMYIVRSYRCLDRKARLQTKRFAIAGFLLSLALPGLSSSVLAQDRQTATGSADTGSGHETHAYRLTYTVVTSDAGKRTSTQHYAMMMTVPGGRASFKQGTKVPILTGGYLHEGAPETTQYQFTYLDVGLNLDAALTEVPGGVQVKAKVELSNIVDQVNPQMLKDPGVRQTVLETSAMAKIGTPVVIGSLDIPDSTRHLDVEVTVDRVS